MVLKRKMMPRTLAISAAIAVVLLAVAAAVVRTYRRGALSSRAEAGKPDILAPSPRVDAGKAERPRRPSGAVSEPGLPAALSAAANAKELLELILHGYPELDRGMRDRVIAQQVRDIFQAAGSTEDAMVLWYELAKEMNRLMYPRLDDEKTCPPELLPLWLGLYQVLMDPENLRMEKGERLFSPFSRDPLGFRVDHEGLLTLIVSAYVQQGRVGEAREWLAQAIVEVEAWLGQLPAGLEKDDGELRRKLKGAQAQLSAWSQEWGDLVEDLVRSQEEAERKREAKLRRIQELEASLQAGAFKTPADEARALADLGDLHRVWDGDYELALYYFERAAQKDPAGPAAREIAYVKAAMEMESWTAEELYQSHMSVDNLKEIGLALHIYATRHGQSFPQTIAELVDKGYIVDPRLLVDPLSGQPFIYVSGLGAGSPPDKVVAKSVGKNGVVARLHVDGHVSGGFEE